MTRLFAYVALLVVLSGSGALAQGTEESGPLGVVEDGLTQDGEAPANDVTPPPATPDDLADVPPPVAIPLPAPVPDLVPAPAPGALPDSAPVPLSVPLTVPMPGPVPAPVSTTGVPPEAYSTTRHTSGGGTASTPLAVPDPVPELIPDSVPTTAVPTTVVTVAAPVDVAVRFAKGLQGWTGQSAKLAALPVGGPSGGGVLEVFTPAGGAVGYIIAPPSLLGDWRGVGGLRITLRSRGGPYLGAFEGGALGDIYLANGGMTAAIAFPGPVGPGWQAQEVSFDDPGWVLGGGAQSVAEVLAHVTDFRIRAEFFSGDAKAWLSTIEPLGRSGPSPVPEGSWTGYTNDRFGTRIDYPTDLFEAMQPPVNGDGRSFVTVDGLARFLVYGEHNLDRMGPRALMERDRVLGAYDAVTDQAAGASWYVMAGRTGGDLFYRRVLIDTVEGVVHVFEISYPATDRARYHEIVLRMGKSFGHL